MSAEPHALAVKRLGRSLARTHPGIHRDVLAHWLGVLDAFVELGVIDAEDVADWTARFERAAQALEPVSAEVQARAVELLERELQSAARAAERAHRLRARESFMVKLQALLETGSIAWSDRSAWVEKLDAVVPDTAPRRAGPPYDGAELRAVIVGPERRLGGLRISSAEVYDDCVIVRWHLVVDADEHRRGRVAAPDHVSDLTRAYGPRSLEDDAGTAYALGPGEMWAMPSVLHLDQRRPVLPGASAFTPGPPETATRLLVACAAGEVQLSLEGAAN